MSVFGACPSDLPASLSVTLEADMEDLHNTPQPYTNCLRMGPTVYRQDTRFNRGTASK